MTEIGFIAARDLGDGQIEPWEQTGLGTLPLWSSAQECRDTLRRWGADVESWRVFALVDQDGDQ
ncbi:hypothetical protein [Pseudonocardia parietis]|uniref:Uncharacterized protein n=1 Tax=Pseudonocardia parietis TaxID=570936 RepID=A0ABS4W231_9PSEU|nr:hypothetical protein [Pseudonocardia parietis]MBP2370262.1 hypothetical protein [Pseudonocardia parietis]